MLNKLVVPTEAATQSLESDLAGGLNVTAALFVVPAGMSTDISSSLFTPEIPLFHQRDALLSMAAPVALQALIFLIRKDEAQGLNTELVTVHTPPNAPITSIADAETIFDPEPAVKRILVEIVIVLLIDGGSDGGFPTETARFDPLAKGAPTRADFFSLDSKCSEVDDVSRGARRTTSNSSESITGADLGLLVNMINLIF